VSCSYSILGRKFPLPVRRPASPPTTACPSFIFPVRRHRQRGGGMCVILPLLPVFLRDESVASRMCSTGLESRFCCNVQSFGFLFRAAD